MGKVRQRLGKAYIHTKEESIKSIIIDALVNHGYDVDVEVTDNGINEVVSCEIYDVMVGHETKVGERDVKEKPKTVTENPTGVVKEDHERVKTVTDILEEVKQEMCDGYCIYTKMIPNFNQECKDICDRCPLTKL